MADSDGAQDDFDEIFYLDRYPHVKNVGLTPYLHFKKYGARLGYEPNKSGTLRQSTERTRQSLNETYAKADVPQKAQTPISPADFEAVARGIDIEWYTSLFPVGHAPADLVTHYLTIGWCSGFEPAPWFSSTHYLATFDDVAHSGMVPFVHYMTIGKYENRALPLAERSLSNQKNYAVDAFRAHKIASDAGPLFEEFDPTIGFGRKPKAKVMAYYLPQFHAFEENDRFWGKGFTEWRNIMRAMPRFDGHLQPRIPRDLGFYNLDTNDTLRRQFELAQAAGIHGFCFYHYWFDGKRVMEAPMERLLADKSLEIPFSIMWANENWSRTWDGNESQLLLKQTYLATDDNGFVDDLARHFKDDRYFRLEGRPIFYIYRASEIPDTQNTIMRWRELLRKRHNLNPLFFMAKTFDDDDPLVFGFDGAIEFPPHKILTEAALCHDDVRMIDPDFSGKIFDYDKVVATATNQKAPTYPLIRTILPSWDNDARRPGRSTIIAKSSPHSFANWARWAMKQAQDNRVYGEATICVNAWNEWAEGAYLEPDTHYGAAYLNALAREIFD
jgi:hypothetical protein